MLGKPCQGAGPGLVLSKQADRPTPQDKDALLSNGPGFCRNVKEGGVGGVRPHRWQPTSLPRPWDSPGKNTGVGCHFLLQCMKVKSKGEVAQ